MDITLIVKVSSRAWSLKILALMAEGVVGRQAPLLSASGASRTAFVQSLNHLVALGMLERNPGYGHPLRPEYLITPLGEQVAIMAARIGSIELEDDQQRQLRRAWTVPVLSLIQKPRFFGEIKGRLDSVTDRALSQSLRQLRSMEWVQRDVDVALSPPRPLYRASNKGLDICHAVGELNENSA